MDGLTCDLKTVVHLEDILVSGANAKKHMQNLQALLQHLQEKGYGASWRNMIFLRNHQWSTKITLSHDREHRKDPKWTP